MACEDVQGESAHRETTPAVQDGDAAGRGMMGLHVDRERHGETLWLDCQMGIAGDMLVAALIDVAEDPAEAEQVVREALESLPVDGFEVEVSRVCKAGLACCDFNVVLDAAHENRDHDMEYLHGYESPEGLNPLARDHALHEHAHEHRGLADVEAIIEAASMAPHARAIALRAFRILASAEATAHGVPIEDVHFHEVGAVDSIVDIIAAAVLLDHMRIENVIVPQLIDGRGTVRCQHGVMPVPVPATLNICRENGLPLSICEVEGELVTPTGAALVAAVATDFDLPERYLVRRVGLGAGKRAYARPSVARAVLIDPVTSRPPMDLPPSSSPHAGKVASKHSQELDAPTAVVKLECDIDDAAGEELGYAADLLREAGAREVHWLPIFTKKGRPAYQLQVICTPEYVAHLESIIFRETPTLGIRRVPMERTALARRRETVETPYGTVALKVAVLPDGSKRVAPEYEDCAALAREHGVPLREVMRAACAAAGTMGA
ncbi:MAG: nickel pincer cofactor biosynthesis protein LarC [Coriobacteriaceae bacterium]|nr:nickel pincer cofactor biosynthesis protein LarC [Coriobacteriaceae bacterium]